MRPLDTVMRTHYMLGMEAMMTANEIKVGDDITLVVNGFATCSVEVTKSTPKAVQVRRIYGDRASTWLPRSVLRRNEKHEFGGFDVAAWFVRKVAAGADPYARIALGLSCW